MSIRVLVAAQLPSGDKVGSPLADACWLVLKLYVGKFDFFFNYFTHIYKLILVASDSIDQFSLNLKGVKTTKTAPLLLKKLVGNFECCSNTLKQDEADLLWS